MLRGSHPTNRRVPGGPPPSGARFPYRGISTVDADFSATLAAMSTMGLNLIEAQIFSGTANLLTRMNEVTTTLGAGTAVKVWSMIGHWTPSTAGGTFTISDTDFDQPTSALATIINGVKNHARNSHFYYLFDEPSLAGYTAAQVTACRNRLRAYRNAIKSYDPLAKIAGADFRQAQLQPSGSFPFGYWGGSDDPSAAVYTDRVMDEIWLSYYPRPNATTGDINTVSSIQGYCNASGIPFTQYVSAHDYKNTLPAYPTQTNFQSALTQADSSNSINIMVYIWEDDWDTSDFSSPERQLRDDPAGFLTQAQVGSVMAAYD